MNILFLLIPVSLAVIGLAVYIFFWAVRNGQFDDLEGPAHSILFDKDEDLSPGKADLKIQGAQEQEQRQEQEQEQRQEQEQEQEQGESHHPVPRHIPSNDK